MTKEKIDKLDVIKIKIFCTSKDIIKTIKKQPTERAKLFVNCITNESLISKIHKELLQFNRKTNNPIKTWAKGLNGHCSKKDIQ